MEPGEQQRQDGAPAIPQETLRRFVALPQWGRCHDKASQSGKVLGVSLEEEKEPRSAATEVLSANLPLLQSGPGGRRPLGTAPQVIKPR